MSDGLGLEDFAVSLADSVFYLPDDKFLAMGTFLRKFKLKKNCRDNILGASENEFWLVHQN